MPPKIHKDFNGLLKQKDRKLQELFKALRALMYEIYPEANEICYHTHALTTVYSLSEKLSDAFCHIPIYTEHLNLGFNFGTSLEDPNKLLQGTGKSIRHVPIKGLKELDRLELKILIADAVAYSMTKMKKPSKVKGQVISKIKNL